jgi:hypothetical protein
MAWRSSWSGRCLRSTARSEALILICVEEYRAHYDTLWNAQTRPYEGIVDMLNGVEGRGVKLGVISNKAHRFTVPMTEHFFGKDALTILGQRAEVPRKPDAGRCARDGGDFWASRPPKWPMSAIPASTWLLRKIAACGPSA